MADDTRRTGRAEGALLLRERFFRRLLLLVTIGLVFLVLSLLRQVDPAVGLVAFAFVVGLALFVPETGEPVGDNQPGVDRSEHAYADAVRHFADALPDPAIIVDRRSIVVHVNAALRQQFPGVVEGNPISYGMRSPTLLGAIEAARQGGTHAVELHQTVPTETWHRVTVASLAPEDPVHEGVLVIVLQSLTEGRRLEAMRSDFIANASHELRTPLTSLLGSIDTLLGPAANDKAARERFLGLMRGQAIRMSKLIEDLLSLSRIEMRQHMRPTAAVDLNLLLAEVAEGLATQATTAGVTLDVVAPDEHQVVAGDRDELYEVFENLIDNAIKYGSDGKTVEVALTPVTTREGYVARVTVTDHGAGVAAEHVPRLTERFYRVDAESSRKKKGTGLGLAIVKHIVTRHQGLMTIRSTPGEGTQVDILLRR